MKLQTKNKIMELLSEESLFSTGGTFTVSELKKLKCWRYDMGKYDSNMRFKEDIKKSYCPAWYELRQDNDGKYLAIMTFKDIPDRLLKIWEGIK